MNEVGGPRGRHQLGDCQNNLNVKGTTVEVEIDGQDQETLWRKKKSFRFHDGLNVSF